MNEKETEKDFYTINIDHILDLKRLAKEYGIKIERISFIEPAKHYSFEELSEPIYCSGIEIKKSKK